MLVHDRDDVELHGTTLAEDSSLAGTVVADELIDFVDGDTSGVLQSRVVQLIGGTYEYSFAIRQLRGQPLQSVSWNLFANNLTTDIDFRLDGLGEVGPSRVYRQDWPPAEADGLALVALNFYFGNALRAGSSSYFVHVKTPLTGFSRYDGMGLYGEPLAGGDSTWSALINAFGTPI